MSAELRIPLDIKEVEIISTEQTENGQIIIEVESTLETTECGICGEKIRCTYGHGNERLFRHLPILGMATYVKFRPKRGECQKCETHPTTTQVVEWYQERSPHTKAYDQWLIKQLINTTIEDVSMRENIGYDAVIGALDRQIETDVNWSEIDDLGTIGIDEISRHKGRKSYSAIVSCRQKNGQTHVLAVLPDRKKRR